MSVLDHIYMRKPWTPGPGEGLPCADSYSGATRCCKLAGDLSGGEKNRLLLGMMLLEEPNLIILDEPTNHLDIASRHALEDALSDFEGTVIVASHDRYFLDRIATRILAGGRGQGGLFDGNFTFYRQEQREREAGARGRGPSSGSRSASLRKAGTRQGSREGRRSA
ncbi:MAG: ATP-binding cassette domain-containing protein [Chromatiales bacterium]|nr:ATP-binding cassette domain-containing protein [Chromatiales bacterium]